MRILNKGKVKSIANGSKHLIAILLFLICCAPSTVLGTILYSTGLPTGGGTGSDFDISGSQQVGDSFLLQEGHNIVSDISWWGFYAYDKILPLPTDNFTIRFYEFSSGSPKTTYFYENTSGSVQRNYYANVCTYIQCFNTYSYSVRISPLVFTPEKSYLLSIINNTSGHDNNWYWSATLQSDFDAYVKQSYTNQWQLNHPSVAFNLSNVSTVPEPATSILFVLGGTLLAGVGYIKKGLKVKDLPDSKRKP